MRDPSLHIKLSDLITVFRKAKIDSPQESAMNVMRLSAPFMVRDRYMVTGTAKTIKKTVRVVAANRQNAISPERFNLLLTACRTAIGHKKISPIRKGTSDYLMLKEITLLATEFVTSCEIDSVEDGCKTYIQLGLELMKYSHSYGLNKFKYYDKHIYAAYESLDMIANDPLPKKTRKFHDTYKTLLMEYAGIERDLLKPEDYVCFLYARLEAERVGTTADGWIRSQFEEISRLFSGVPNPNQLYSVNSVKRYWQYVRVTSIAPDSDFVKLDWEAPKNEFERKYAERIRNKNRD